MGWLWPFVYFDADHFIEVSWLSVLWLMFAGGIAGSVLGAHLASKRWRYPVRSSVAILGLGVYVLIGRPAQQELSEEIPKACEFIGDPEDKALEAQPAGCRDAETDACSEQYLKSLKRYEAELLACEQKESRKAAASAFWILWAFCAFGAQWGVTRLGGVSAARDFDPPTRMPDDVGGE